MVELNIASRRQNLWNIPNAFGCVCVGGGGGSFFVSDATKLQLVGILIVASRGSGWLIWSVQLLTNRILL